jgi:hypothetical protein
MKLLSSTLFSLAALSLAASTLAQPATSEQRAGVPNDPSFRTLHLRTNLGSFKLIDGHGRVEISFTGTVLIVNLQGTHTTSGDLTLQFNDRGRRAYFGTGRIVVTGQWRGIQCFGRRLSATWFGRGVAHVSGDFDRNLETGWYWFDDPARREAFPSAGIRTVLLPDQGAAVHEVVPRARRPATPRDRR